MHPEPYVFNFHMFSFHKNFVVHFDVARLCVLLHCWPPTISAAAPAFYQHPAFYHITSFLRPAPAFYHNQLFTSTSFWPAPAFDQQHQLFTSSSFLPAPAFNQQHQLLTKFPIFFYWSCVIFISSKYVRRSGRVAVHVKL